MTLLRGADHGPVWSARFCEIGVTELSQGGAVERVGARSARPKLQDGRPRRCALTAELPLYDLRSRVARRWLLLRRHVSRNERHQEESCLPHW